MVDCTSCEAKVSERIRRWLRVWDLPKATIAQVHGYCLAGATQLASVCDMTLVAEDGNAIITGLTRGEMVHNKEKLYELGGTLPKPIHKWDENK